jgi:type I restriction enzyme, S subunit
MIHQNHVFRVRLHSDSLNPFFISHYANEMGRRFFIEEGKQTTNLASISLSKISMLPVPVPPPAEAAEILRRASDALAAAADVLGVFEAEAADAARLRQSILKAAFEGRLVAQDVADEPATALLSRLAAETPAVRASRGRARKSDA